MKMHTPPSPVPTRPQPSSSKTSAPQQQQQPQPQQSAPTRMHEVANVAPRPEPKRIFTDWAAL